MLVLQWELTADARVLRFGSYQERSFAVTSQSPPISCAAAHLGKLPQSTQTRLLPEPRSDEKHAQRATLA